MQRTQLLLRSVASGTLLGLFGPGVLCLVLILRLGEFPAEHQLWGFVVSLLLFGIPACTCALIGGVSAVLSNHEAKWPEGWLAAIVTVFWVVLLVVVAGLGDEGRAVVVITALAANSWVSGWYAIRVVRKARRAEGTHRAGESPRITPEMERVVRAHFVTTATGESKEAIRAEPQELTEPPRPT